METIIGIDLGTTNSEVAVVREGRPIVLPGEDGDPILPSVVGLDPEGRLLVGKAARNQFALAPERTIRSIKRLMGQETTVTLGERSHSPQEISAIILRTLKERAEKALGRPVRKAVITVPAFFTEDQRDATREAGELAGLEVVRIINEPTAAILTYEPHPADRERLLVYDLGGGTFDVSVAQVEGGVIEILASHGDTHLGGDDFDQRLLDHVCDDFRDRHQIDLRDQAVSRSRVLRAVEDAKKTLSSEAVARIDEEFIASSSAGPLHLRIEIERADYETLIEPLLDRTLRSLDQALDDANLQAPAIDRVVLVGGATRTPLVHRMLQERLGRPLFAAIEPDLAVALGAAVQGALISGEEVGAILVDITPHTLGIEALGVLHDHPSPHTMAPIIERNTPLPASRTEIFATVTDGQKAAEIRVFQGEGPDTRHNHFVGEFAIEGLANVHAGNQIVVRLDLDLNGILKVTATERATGLARQVTIDNAMERFRRRDRADALGRLEEVFRSAEGFEEIEGSEGIEGFEETESEEDAGLPESSREAIAEAETLIGKAGRLRGAASPEDAGELDALVADLRAAIDRRDEAVIRRVAAEVEDILFYLEDQ